MYTEDIELLQISKMAKSLIEADDAVRYAQEQIRDGDDHARMISLLKGPVSRRRLAYARLRESLRLYELNHDPL